VGISAVPKRTPRINLLPGHHRLFRSQESGTRLTANRARQAEVGTVARFRILGAGATGFAAPDGALRKRAAAHGLNVSKFGGKLMNLRRNRGRRSYRHGSILRHLMP